MNKDLVRSMFTYQLELNMDDSSDQKELFEAYAQVCIMVQNGQKPPKDLIKPAIELVNIMADQCKDILDVLTYMYEMA